MFSFAALSPFLQNPYSLGFVAIWLSMGVVASTLWFFEKSFATKTKVLESWFFWLFGLILIAFVVFRPIGIARDDLTYMEMYKAICPTLACGQWLQGGRDVGWYSLVGFLKSVVADARIMLWIGAAGLLIKLAVIFNLTKYPLISLLFYTGIYYQVQDLTAWRVSLSLSIFMASIWILIRSRSYWSAWILLVCGFFHKQGFLAPMILVGIILKRSRFIFILSVFGPIGLIFLGIYPNFESIAVFIGEKLNASILIQGLDSYISSMLAGAYSGWRRAPIVAFPLILITFWFLIRDFRIDNKIQTILTGCLVIACLFLWGFTSLPDVQVRFFEFFMMPTVLLAGIRRLFGLELLGVFFVSGVFVAKYNIVHQLIVHAGSS